MKTKITNSQYNLKVNTFALNSLKLLSALVFFSSLGFAQSIDDIPNLVFEPALLSTAADSIPDQTMSSSERRDLESSIAGYEDTIAALKQSNASNSDLIAQLGPLGVAFQTLGRHGDAITTLNEAISLIPENSTDQIPLQEQLILSYLANDDIDSVDNIEELIYSIYIENFGADSQEVFFATVNLADWNLTAYYKENYGPRGMNVQRNVVPQTMRAGNSGGGDATTNAIFSGNIKELNNSDITDLRVRRVTQLYEDYQEALFATGNVQLAIILEIAKRTASIAFITKQEMDFERDNTISVSNYEGSRIQAARNAPERLDESYQSGRDALEYAISTLNSVSGVPKETIAMAQLDLADWHLAYGKVQAAQNGYSEATQSLIDAGFSAENVDIALATAMPLPIPLFATHLYTRGSAGVRAGQNLDIQGYVDLSFNINDIGNAGNLQISNSSTEDHSTIERLIDVQLKSLKYRPSLQQGELVGQGKVDLRYYFAY